MAATWAALIEKTRGHLRGLLPPAVNLLNAGINDSATSLTLQVDGPETGIGVGSVIEINTELIRVGAITTVTASSLIRGWAGTTAAAHSAGDVVRRDPSTTGSEIQDALDETLRDMTARGLHRIDLEEVTPDGEDAWFALTNTDIEKVWAIQGRDSDAASKPLVPPRWQAFYNAPTDISSTGVAVQLERIYSTGVELHVTIGRELPSVGTLTTNPVTDGLAGEYHDIAALGAAAIVLDGEEAQRNLVAGQGSTRRASEVVPGALASSGDLMRRQYNRRVAVEADRLSARFPPKGQLSANL